LQVLRYWLPIAECALYLGPNDRTEHGGNNGEDDHLRHARLQSANADA
jgi:hypothetical protein